MCVVNIAEHIGLYARDRGWIGVIQVTMLVALGKSFWQMRIIN